MPCTFAFEAIGTAWNIDVQEELSPERQTALLAAVMARIDVFDRAYSRFRADSLVTEMAERAGTYVLPDDAGPLMETYERLYRLTGGAFTPLIGQVMVDAGYDAAYSLTPKELCVPPAWDDVIAYEHPRLTMKRAAWLDFGAGGKGYLVDLIGALLEAEGVRAFCVDAGGDIVYRGARPLRVGLEHPEQPGQAIGIATVAGGSICGSAGNRRAWANFHHTIDPRTLQSPSHVLATWAMAETGLIADALATCLYFVPAEALRKEYAFEWVVFYADHTATHSEGALVELFT